MKQFIGVWIIASLHVFSIFALDFSYKNSAKWSSKYKDCGSSSQSPIDLNSRDFKYTNEKETLKWTGSKNKPTKTTLTNTGHTLRLEPIWEDGKTPSISGNLVNDATYKFKRMEFHWGRDDNYGSEHNFDGKAFPAEMHLIYYNKKYNSYEDAVNHQDGLAIIAVLFQLDQKGREFTPIIDQIPHVIEPGSSVDLCPFALSDLEGSITEGNFITYSGSLTTPPCSEVVTWLVLNNTVGVNDKQISTLKKLKLSNGDDHNYRPTQPLNNRKINLWA